MTKEQAVLICNLMDSKPTVSYVLKLFSMSFQIRVYKSPQEDTYENDCRRVAKHLRELAEALESPSNQTFIK